MLLGNETGSKTASNIPVSKLTLSGRDYSYIELSQKGFNSLIELFKNDLLNNGRMEYGLEGAELYNEILKQMTKHIMKISISKPDGFGTHKKVYSFISFDNKNIGAETGSYRNITEGLTSSKKLQVEVDEFLTLFGDELDNVLTPCTDVELENYVKGIASSESVEKASTAGVVPKAQKTETPKEEQVVIEEDETFVADDADDDLFEDDISDITLDDNKPSATTEVALDDEDMSFNMDDEEDFFGDE